MEIIADGYACRDCVLMMANGETGDPDDSDARIQEVAEATAGWCSAGDEANPDNEFSGRPCRCCGSHFAGWRGWAVKLG